MAVGKTARNERLKLFAGLLHSAATTCMALGLFAPLAASVYNAGNVGTFTVTGVVGWAAGVVVFHSVAQIILGGLRD